MQNSPSRNNSNQLAKKLVALELDVFNLSILRPFFYLTSHNPLKWSSESYPAQAVAGWCDPSLQDETKRFASARSHYGAS